MIDVNVLLPVGSQICESSILEDPDVADCYIPWRRATDVAILFELNAEPLPYNYKIALAITRSLLDDAVHGYFQRRGGYLPGAGSSFPGAGGYLSIFGELSEPEKAPVAEALPTAIIEALPTAIAEVLPVAIDSKPDRACTILRLIVIGLLVAVATWRVI